MLGLTPYLLEIEDMENPCAIIRTCVCSDSILTHGLITVSTRNGIAQISAYFSLKTSVSGPTNRYVSTADKFLPPRGIAPPRNQSFLAESCLYQFFPEQMEIPLYVNNFETQRSGLPVAALEPLPTTTIILRVTGVQD